MKFAHRISGISAALVMSGSALVAASASASATPTADPCAGKPANHIVKNYTRSFVTVPLRCGTSTWGYRHLVPKHGFNDGQIANTVARGKQSFGFYYTNLNQCPPTAFKVVFNNGAIGGTGVRPQGIVTAYYQPGHISSVAPNGIATAC